MQVSANKQEKSIPKTRVSISIDHTLPAKVDAEAAQLGVSASNIYERAVNAYFASGSSVSTTVYEKKHIAKQLLWSNCGRLETAMVEATDIPIMKYFRYFFANCTHLSDGATNKSRFDIDKDKENSVFILLEALKYIDTELYDIIINEMGNYGHLRDRYYISIGI